MKEDLFKRTFGEKINEDFTAEEFSGHLGELLADPVADQIPLHIRRFLQSVYEVACDTVAGK